MLIISRFVGYLFPLAGSTRSRIYSSTRLPNQATPRQTFRKTQKIVFSVIRAKGKCQRVTVTAPQPKVLMITNGCIVVEKRQRDGPGVFKEVLGLTGQDSTGEWAGIWTTVNDILRRHELIGKKLCPINDEDKKNEIAEELEAFHEKAFAPLGPADRRKLIHRIFRYGLENSRRKPEVRQRQRPLQPVVEEALVETPEESLADIPLYPRHKEVIITLGLPSVPGFETQFVRNDLVKDGELSLAKVFEILDEEGLHCEPDNYAVFDESGKRLVSPRHLAVAFQHLLNEEKLESQWLVLRIGEEWFPGRRFTLPSTTPSRLSSLKGFHKSPKEPGPLNPSAV